jgi:S-methylmethionine-dependent homocysteine/selenocysteine methylase/SAM-dependent methyltransferase
MVRTDLPTDQTAGPERPGPVTGGYENVGKLLAAGSCVLLDGPVVVPPRPGGAAPPGLTPTATLSAETPPPDPGDLVAAHREHVESGCDVIRTHTAALWPARAAARYPDGTPARWVDLARERVEAAREAVAGSPAAVAFALGRHVDGADSAELVRALDRLFGKAAPDLVLVETLSVIRPSLYAAVSRLRSLGLPVWLSFRRCRDGLCGPSGHHWSGDEPDRFGSAAGRLEQTGVAALLVNCIPPDHVAGTLEYLRYFTDLPLGVYANIEQGFEPTAIAAGKPPPSYDELAVRWRAEGAQIIGGCCGVGAEHLWAARGRLADAPAIGTPPAVIAPAGTGPAAGQSGLPWQTAAGRALFPLPFPALACDQTVPAPSAVDLLLWEHLYREGTGAGRRCLDVGSGSGLLAVQLALNGAGHVHSIDRSPAAVDSTRRCAFRNDMSSAVTAEAADIATWQPREHYDVVVASLEQPATDPCQQDPLSREFDPWGRRLIDAFLAKLPALLARGGVAYLTQSSLISQKQTDDMLSAAGLAARVVDWRLWPASAPADAGHHRQQIEQRSDAFHLDVAAQGGHDGLMVVYLLEIRRAGTL